jgi:hypothetical protein
MSPEELRYIKNLYASPRNNPHIHACIAEIERCWREMKLYVGEIHGLALDKQEICEGVK